MQGERGFDDTGLRLEVIAPDAADGERLLAEHRRLMLDLNVYRGKVLALKEGVGLSVEFPSVERVDRDDIVLPDGCSMSWSSTRSSSRATATCSAPADGTSVAVCCSTARPGPARR
jgi:hypothetical protein